MVSRPCPDAGPPALTRLHLRRLRQYYRSAGWAYQDNVELELLAAGLIVRHVESTGVEAVRVTGAGLAALRTYLDGNREARGAHETLVVRVAAHLAAQGRLVFRGLALRARVEERWTLTRPDVYSIRPSTTAPGVRPIVHEIKVCRADLLSDLKRAEKRTGYQAIASEVYYVIEEGIGTPDEIPRECGVVIATRQRLVTARRAEFRAIMLRIDQWVALARARREVCDLEPQQLELGDAATGEDADDGE